jgi:hypothetical protein
MHNCKIPRLHHLSGRLGNQLFEWAFAIQSNKPSNRPIIFFTDKFHQKPSSIKDFKDGFKVSGQELRIINTNWLGLLLVFFDKINTNSPKIARYFERILLFYRSKEAFVFPEKLPNSSLFVTGFFINHKAFSSVENEIFEKLNRIISLTKVPENLGLPEKYQVIHARRGDFLVNEQLYGILDSKYYADNIDKDLPIVLCTDDPSNCQDLINHLKITKVLSPTSASVWQTLKVMSLSKRVVMSNSTFAWWGSFLCVKNGGTATVPIPFYPSQELTSRDALSYPGFELVNSIFRNPLQ